ncbi:MAG TPA: right-handed parallel beta-helix repeat-containing protein [Streptosporangiaceae bacterium]|nr:right-handed parallel beta-helix repeat-containing protein [Streptosporangiaceae bacterium]
MRQTRERREQDDWLRQATGLPRRSAGLAVITASALDRVLRSRRVTRLAGRALMAVLPVAVAIALAAVSTPAMTSYGQVTIPSPPEATCGNASILDGPSSPPGGATTIPAGDNSGLLTELDQPDMTFWFAPGVHTLGTSIFSQIAPGNNSTFLGAPGAIIDGQSVNDFAFVGDHTGVTIEYLTVQDFRPASNQAAVDHDSGPHWTIQYNTIQYNAPGTGVYIGDDSVLDYNCITQNGQQGFGGVGSLGAPLSNLTDGPSNLAVDYNEISYNDTCNWEDDDYFPGPPPPPDCAGAVPFKGCGCTGAGKFWESDISEFTGNYVHNNWSAGPWWDTDNVGMTVEDNYIADNWGIGIDVEISYNALIKNNVLIDNAWNGRESGGFPPPAIYISESGSDSRVPGPNGQQFLIEDNQFYDNYGGVVLWENSDRFCGALSGIDGSCTLVNGVSPLGQRQQPVQAPAPPSSRRGQPGPGRVMTNTPSVPHTWSVTDLGPCSQIGIISSEPYFSDCRWKTQHVRVQGNFFWFNPGDIPYCAIKSTYCGFSGVFSEFGIAPPYFGTGVEENITFNQDNLFTGNIYCGPWQFDALAQGAVVQWGSWVNSVTAGGYGQDPGSTLNSSALCNLAPPLPTGTSGQRPVTIPYKTGRW